MRLYPHIAMQCFKIILPRIKSGGCINREKMHCNYLQLKFVVSQPFAATTTTKISNNYVGVVRSRWGGSRGCQTQNFVYVVFHQNDTFYLKKKFVNVELSIFFQVIHILYNPADSGAVQLTSDNVDMTLGKNCICLFPFL